MLDEDSLKRKFQPSDKNEKKLDDINDDLLSLDVSVLGSFDFSEIESSTQTSSEFHQTSTPTQKRLRFSRPSLVPVFDDGECDSGIGPQLSGRNDEHLIKLIDYKSSLLLNSTLDVSFSSRNESFNIDVDADESFYGLPTCVKNLFEIHKGIKELYQWQDEVLKLERLKSRDNILLILPTSGGKTLIAELLILKELICWNRNAVFILPYVSLVHEKVNSLSPFALELGFTIEEYAGSKGSYPPNKRKKRVVYISTIEKADILVNSLIDTDRYSEIGLIVVDEFHLMGESSRGAIIESILIKSMHLKPDIHIVALSATLGNPDEIATFLNGFVFVNNFRPTSLHEYVKIDDDVYQILYDKCVVEPLKFIKKFKNKSKYKFTDIDPDLIGLLVDEVVPNKSCLVFCPTKKNCENICSLICKTLPDSLLKHKKSEKESLIRALLSEGNGNICSILRRSLRYGIAYHHSGLMSSERKIIEEAFIDNTICCICCTSTLAAGVNLPAARVILRSPYVGSQFLSFNQYKQMVGRAGRAGFEEKGESILISNSADALNINSLVTSTVGNCYSQLGGEPLVRFILSSLSLGLAKNRSELLKLMELSLLSKQKPLSSSINEEINDVLKELITSDTIKEENGNIILTDIGKAAVKANINIEIAKMLFKDLTEFKSKLVLSSHLHLLYLITPYDSVNELNPGPDTISNILLSLNNNLIEVADIVGITERVIAQIVSGRTVKLPNGVLKRFFGALIINELLSGCNLWAVAKKFNSNRGFILSFLTMASTFASATLRFCEVFPDEFWMYLKLLSEYPQKIMYCCSQELIELMELPAVRLGRARQLFNAGYKDISSVASAEPRTLTKSIDMLPLRQAKLIVSSAKLMLLSKAELLQEEAQDILEGMTKPTEPEITNVIPDVTQS